jgi:hypothetical protein
LMTVDTGLLIFENSDWYPKTITRLNKQLKWLQVDFAGFGPINNYTWTTSIFIDPSYQPNLTYVRNLCSIGGTGESEEIDY